MQKIPVYTVHPVSLWAPLALGLMTAHIDARLSATHLTVYPFALSWPELQTQIQTHGPGVVLFSNYMWTRQANLEISAQVKAFSPESVVIHGGPDTPAYSAPAEAYLKKYPAVDLAIYGEGEHTLLHVLQALAQGSDLQAVSGIGFLHNGQLVKTPARTRSQDLNAVPSPYLTGVFESLAWQHWTAATIETNRGCPYGCSFCDWGSATMQKMRHFELQRIRAEVEWIAQHKIPKLWIADSNFGIFERDLEITKIICEVKQQYGYPRLLITNYAKNTKQHLIDIIELLVEHGLVSTGIVSMQTRDAQTLKAVRRSNIKNTEYDRLRQTFEARKLPMSTQLMIGLPGSTRESFKADLRFFFNQTIDVQIFRTVVLPNSPMAAPEYIAEHELDYAENGMLLSTRLLSRSELNEIEQLARLFICTQTYGMFRYWLCFLKWDYGIDPIDTLDALVKESQTSTDPWLKKLWDHDAPPHDLLTSHANLREHLRATDHLNAFYQSLKLFTLRTYPQVAEDQALESILQAQAAVMPNANCSYPLKLNLPHDVVRYYAEHHQSQQGQPLHTYAPGSLLIQDPLGVSSSNLLTHLQQRDRPTVIWELKSDLSPENTEAALFLVQSLSERAAQT